MHRRIAGPVTAIALCLFAGGCSTNCGLPPREQDLMRQQKKEDRKDAANCRRENGRCIPPPMGRCESRWDRQTPEERTADHYTKPDTGE